jgi:predicted transcriptional regulator
MKLLAIYDRLILMDRLIREKKTGTPKEFALKLNVSDSYLYKCLDQLRELGATVKYNKDLKSYEYPIDYIVIIQKPIVVVDKQKGAKNKEVEG